MHNICKHVRERIRDGKTLVRKPITELIRRAGTLRGVVSASLPDLLLSFASGDSARHLLTGEKERHPNTDPPEVVTQEGTQAARLESSGLDEQDCWRTHGDRSSRDHRRRTVGGGERALPQRGQKKRRQMMKRGRGHGWLCSRGARTALGQRSDTSPCRSVVMVTWPPTAFERS